MKAEINIGVKKKQEVLSREFPAFVLYAFNF